MKVFKIIKYHIPYSKNSTHALCSQTQRSSIGSAITSDSCSTLLGLPYSLYYSEHEYYNENMDLCKTCRRINFERIVRKLKGKGSF